jgi:hypothetical protein
MVFSTRFQLGSGEVYGCFSVDSRLVYVRDAKKQKSGEKKKSKKQRSRKAKTQGNINPKKKDKTGKK